MGDDVNEEGERVELFGALELVLSETNFNWLQGHLLPQGPQEETLPGQDLAARAQGTT
jgi:hypothetical protein